MRAHSKLVVAFAALAMQLAACATNPVSGKRELAMISEAQEIEMGREADRDVVQSIGLYQDDRWQRYIQELGSRLAAETERPNLPWTFRVVDDASVNAFAIPGGFVYVTRGILAHMNSEAELASVLGHEIGHVTARHSVSQMSKQSLAQLGLGVAMVLVPEAAPYGGLASQGLGQMFLKFSRTDESEADRLGFRYMLERGYDPREMANVFDVLARVSQASGGGRLPQWAASHPDPTNRRAWAAQTAAGLERDLSNLTVNREPYLQRLDGMVFGANPREGFFANEGKAGGTFYHPELRFRIGFPSGWTTSNQKTSVSATSPNEDARLVLALADGVNSPAAAAEKFFAQQGIRAGQAWRRDINGLPAASYSFDATTQQGELSGLVAWVDYGGKIYQILGFTPANRFRAYSDVFASSIGSFSRETSQSVLSVEPRRLKIQELSQPRSFEEVVRQFPSTVGPETLALLNHVDANARLPAGTDFKRVVGGPTPGR